MEYMIDAQNQILGRLASDIASSLQGKKSAGYDPRLPSGVRVVVKNAGKIIVSGRKFNQKVYHHHTGYMGHLRTKTFREEFEKSPKEVLRRAVYNMLPKNRIRAKRLKQLVIYDGEN